ncbi:MAG: hypothetical protein HXY20_09585 [Acidobacteria bacterium]|nr:hypothetical protein [Acidobacteriota bacterium]
MYRVMSRGVDKCPTLCSDEDRVLCLRLVGQLVALGAMTEHAICQMTNHFHMLCKTPVGELSRRLVLYPGEEHGNRKAAAP